jgi:hypothetical protein
MSANHGPIIEKAHPNSLQNFAARAKLFVLNEEGLSPDQIGRNQPRYPKPSSEDGAWVEIDISWSQIAPLLFSFT